MRKISIAFLMTLIIVIAFLVPQLSTFAADSSLKVEFNNGNTSTISNTIYANFKVTNLGSAALNLSDLKLRYYYTADADKPQSFWCDHAGMMNGWNYVGVTDKVTGTFVKMSSAVNKADTYLEVGFKSDAGSLPAGGSIEIQTRVARNDWTNYDQSNDYSFKTLSSYGDNDRITVYLKGSLIYGYGGTIDITDPTITPTTIAYDKYAPTDLKITLAPNGNTFKGVTGLTPGTDYTVSGNTVTILKSCLNSLAVGTKAFAFDLGVTNNPVLKLAVKDSTPMPLIDAIVGTATGMPGDTVTVPITFRNVAKAGNVGICNFNISYDTTLLEAVSVAPGPIITNAENNFSSQINATSGEISFVFLDYTIGNELIKSDGVFAGITFKIKPTLTQTTTPLEFVKKVSSDANGIPEPWANTTNGSITIKIPEIAVPTITPATAVFDSGIPADVVVTIAANGNTFKGITGLTLGTNYTVSGNTVTILKSYLNSLAVGTKAFTFDFGVPNNPVLAITTRNEMPWYPLGIKIGTAKGVQGDTVTVPITLEKVQQQGNVGCLNFYVNYDKTLLEAVSVAPGNIVVNPDVNYYTRIDANTGIITIVFLDNTIGNELITTDGIVANITFNVLGTAIATTPIVFKDGGVVGDGQFERINYITYTNGNVAIDNTNGLDVSIGKVTGKEGEIVTVPVSFANIAKSGNIMSCDFKVGYDTNLLEVVSVEPGSIVTNPEVNFGSNINTTSGAISFLFLDYTVGSQLISNDGVFANINFRLNTPTAFQFTTPVTIKELGAFADLSLNEIPVKQTYGSVTIIRTSTPEPKIYPSMPSFVLGSSADLKITLMPNGNTFKGVSGMTMGTDYSVSGNTVTILKSYMNSLEVGTKELNFDFGIEDKDPVLAIAVKAGTPIIDPNYKKVDTHIPANLVVNITPNGNILKGIAGLTEGTDYILSKNTVIFLKSYLSTLTLGFKRLTFDFGIIDNPYLALAVNDSTPVETGLDVSIGTVEGKTGETVTVPIYLKDVAKAGNVKDAIFFIDYNRNLLEAVSIDPGPIVSDTNNIIGNVMGDGLIAMNSYEGSLITEDGVYANITFKLKTPVAKRVTTPISFSLFTTFVFYDQYMNEIEPVSRKAGSVTIDNNAVSVEKAIYPTIAEFDTYIPKDVVVTIMPNADTFKGITGLIQGTDYTVSGNTVTILKSYLSTIDHSTKTFTFDLDVTNNPVLTMKYYDSTPYNYKELLLAIGTVTGEVGDIVKVPITLSNVSKNGNVSYAEFCIIYDTDLLEPIVAEAGPIINNANANFSSVINPLNGTISFVFFDNTLGNELITEDGVFANINFKLKSPISTPIKTLLTYKYYPTFGDWDFKQITDCLVAGSVTINANN